MNKINIKGFKLLVILFTCFSSMISFGQKMTITGTVFDSTGINKLSKASVSLVRLNDSVLVDFTRSNTEGSFSFQTEIDTFYLLIEHPQFDNKTLYVFGNPAEPDIVIPMVRVGIKVKDLAEVVVHGNKNRIYYKGDTLVYVADSFKVAANAVVEDLLKKLPGIKIDENGQITSQGREISQVLVDGDEFFGTDPTIATKNLGAKGVESVQIYEKEQKDNSSGTDEKIQVMDLKLKEEAKKGYFGKVAIASEGGLIGNPSTNNPFYEAELLYNQFNRKQKFSVFLLTSNTPRSKFKWGDMNKFGLENERETSGMSMWDQSSLNDNSGIPQTIKSGIYYNNRFGKSGKIGFNYSYNESRLNANQSSLSQYFLTDSSYYTKDSVKEISHNVGHQINFNFSTNIDSLTTFEIKPTLKYDLAQTENTTINQFKNEDFTNTFATNIANNNDSKGYRFRVESTLKHMFMKPRREIELKYILNSSDNSTAGSLITQSIFNGFTDSVDQKRYNDNGSILNYGTITYREPLSAKWKAQLEYFIEYGNSYQERRTFDKGNGDYSNEVSIYSNHFENKRTQHRGTASLIFESSAHVFNAGIGLRSIALDNYNVLSDTSILQNFINVLPKMSYHFKPSMSKRLNVNYFTNSNQPSLNDIQPVQDNSNPNRIKIGNPNLKPNYVHNLNFQFNTWQAMTGRYIWSGVNSSYTNNAFGTNTIYDTLGRTVSSTINVNGNVFSNVYAGFGLPFFNRKLELMPNFNASISRYTNLINNQENITLNPTIGGGMVIELKFDSLEISLTQEYFFSSPKSTFSSLSSTPFSTQKYDAEIKWTLPWHFKVTLNGKYTINSQRASGFNRNIFVVNAEIQKAFLPTENLVLAINTYDLLNQNLNLQRQVNGNIITDNYTQVITRYFLLKLTYRFNKNKTKEDDFEGWH